MNPQFETPEDIDREYQRRIEQAPNGAEAAKLRVEAAEAKLQLRQQAENLKLVDAWKKLALIEFPHAAKFPELVQGRTEDEILRAAEAAHKRVEEMMRQTGSGDPRFDSVRQQAQDFYGPGPSTGGSTGAPTGYTPPNMAEDRWNRQFAEQFNNAPRDMYGQRMGISPSDVTRFTNNRFITHVKDRIRFWGQMTRSSG
jgi:hypothetical protein